MELYKRLQLREVEGRPIRTGLVGCGQMGSGLVHVTRQMEGMDTFAVADIDVERPKAVLKEIGIPEDKICITNKPSQAEDIINSGKYLITEDAVMLVQLDALEVVIEATGITEIGAKVAWTGITNKKHIVMLNVETDVTVGLILNRIAEKTGCVYTVAEGDEPAVCKMLYDFSKTLGFEVVCLGKGKNNPVDNWITPEVCKEEAIRKGMNPKMLASFIDGTKTMVEMAAVSNATGLVPDVPGMCGPKVELDELNKVFIPEKDGGILNKSGCVDYSTGKIAPGVFAVVKTDEARILRDMNFVSMGEGPYFTFFRPYHLCNIETPIAAAKAVIYGEPTVTAKDMYSEVVSIAKRDLKAGDIAGDIGSADFFNRIYTYEEARKKKAIPMGIVPGGRVIKNIPKGEAITQDNFQPDTSSFIYKLRMMQDALIENLRN